MVCFSFAGDRVKLMYKSENGLWGDFGNSQNIQSLITIWIAVCNLKQYNFHLKGLILYIDMDFLMRITLEFETGGLIFLLNEQ